MSSRDPTSRDGAAAGCCVNVGCGARPTAGWINFDSSPTVVLAKLVPPAMLGHRGEFASIIREHGVRWSNAKRLPLRDGVARAFYSAHMLEHMTRPDALRVLAEAHRVLRSGGVVRISVPDLEAFVRAYLEMRDGDWFMRESLFETTAPTLLGRLRALVFGPLGHVWLYDETSLKRLLTEAGFLDPARVAPGETRIVEPGTLDLFERQDGFCMEAVRP